MSKHSRNFVTIYNLIRCYGGAEEGGWYYSVYEPQYVKVCSSKRTALREEKRLKDLWGRGYIVQIEKPRTLFELDNTNEPRPRYS